MIPERLYIPTSTLNFNNIMASESISPASFYSIRGYGYKRFTKVAPNNLDNRIILYDKYISFCITDKEMENYPMVIEIDTKTINEDIIQEQNTFFFADETIYINPFNTKFIFRNEQEKVNTLSKAEPSIETKMVPLYADCFEFKQRNIESFEWSKKEIEDSKNDISKYISKDRRINKLKGFMYAYLLASNKSVSSDIVSLKKNVKDIRNILSAIITSPDGQATYSQKGQLESLYKLINDKFMNILPKRLLKEKSKKYNCDFYELLMQENLFESWLRQNNLSNYQVKQFYLYSKDKEKEFDYYIQNLEKQIADIEFSRKKSKADIQNLPVLQNSRINNIPEQKEFLTKLFNEYLEEAYSSEDFLQSRYEFAKAGGKVFKEEIQDKWGGSQWQQYINALLKNLNEYTSFNIKDIDNLTLQSFAAFCQKGANDIDKLEDYLISNEIGDFRIAFSLWGIVFGFANMPKTLTNDLFLSDDLDYIIYIYKFIFKQIHGIELNGKIEKKQKEILIVPSKINELPINRSNQQVESRSKLEQELSKYEEFISKDEKFKNEIVSKLIEFGIFSLNSWDDKKVNTIKWNSKKGQKKLMAAIKKSKAKGTSEKKDENIKQESLSFFENTKPELGADFYKDSNVWSYIEPLVPKNSHKKVKTEIDWIQGVHKDNGYKKKSGEWVSLSDHSNKSVIKHFENNAKTRIDSRVLKKIVDKLNELYL